MKETNKGEKNRAQKFKNWSSVTARPTSFLFRVSLKTFWNKKPLKLTLGDGKEENGTNQLSLWPDVL